MKLNKNTMKKLNKVIKKTLISVGREVREIQIEAIQEDVYDYYDEIRSGYNISNMSLYHRSGRLIDINNIKVKYSGVGTVVIRNESYSKDILNDIRFGNVSWEKSILAKLSPSERARDFIAGTMERLEKYNINEKMKLELYRNGIIIKR